MSVIRPFALPLALAAALAGCTTPQGPAEVTTFAAPGAQSRLGQGTVFVETGDGADSLALAPYRDAVAAELGRIGYTVAPRAGAGQIATVRVDRYLQNRDQRRSPVSVGVGGSTGGFGSGVGLGVGINLGGGGRDLQGTQLAVAIRDAAGAALWEGRADLRVADNSPLAPPQANAQSVAAALFRNFPNGSGETVMVEVAE